MKKLLFLIFLSIVLLGCQNKANYQLDEEALLKEELEKIDWSKVDTYPSVESCDSLTDNQAKKDCFFSYVTQNLQLRLNADTIQGNFDQLDTLKILVTVQANSTIDFQLYEIPDSLKGLTKTIDDILHKQSQDFSTVHPALKRGVPVKSQFVVPVVLSKQ